MSQIYSQFQTALKPEERAYIHQQLDEFVPFCMPDSHALVKVQKKDRSYVVTLRLTGSGSHISSKGTSKNFYKAVLRAKEQVLGHLQSVQQEATSEEERMAELLWHKNSYLIQ